MIGLLLGLVQAVAPAFHATLPSPISHYISPLDYPANALPSKAEGRVEIRLGIDPLGRVTDCLIRKSSGSSILDRETCQILHRRLKFDPARNAADTSISDSVDAAIDWHLPPPDVIRRMQTGTH